MRDSEGSYRCPETLDLFDNTADRERLSFSGAFSYHETCSQGGEKALMKPIMKNAKQIIGFKCSKCGFEWMIIPKTMLDELGVG